MHPFTLTDEQVRQVSGGSLEDIMANPEKYLIYPPNYRPGPVVGLPADFLIGAYPLPAPYPYPYP